ncbi:PRC-barrel domain-containing protein [Sphingopyxis sp. MWB1]|uniref:PRC-barrel domain-containing protein n=1 Tax=Sphingopyxis sp. MWB1 TaxID=1537715 RepID=UPI00051A0325|nr:PRC-barrel domain-containing protein [Sphingopyxis sp. MWB1]
MTDTLERNETHRLISSEKVEGTAVYSPESDKLGTVSHVMIDKRSGQAEYAVLEFGGLFGIGSDHYPIPWDMLSYDTDKGGYIVNLSKEQIEGAPRYQRDSMPVYDDNYGRTVFSYYGLNYPAL